LVGTGNLPTKVKQIVADIESRSIRAPEANFTRLALWLEQFLGFQRPQAEAAAQQIVLTYRNQWIA
jgi:hypothetical protein